MSEFYPSAIDLSKIEKDRVNAWALDENTNVAVVWAGENSDQLRVFRDFCAHMGAKFSDGKLCDGGKTVQCPWHGYFFSLESGEFCKNPNDEIFAKMKSLYKSYKPEKTPKYRLAMMSFKIENGKAYVFKRAESKLVQEEKAAQGVSAL